LDGSALSGKCQQVVRYVDGPLSFATDHSQILADIVGSVFLHEQFGKANYACKRVVKLMGGAGCEFTDGSQPSSS